MTGIRTKVVAAAVAALGIGLVGGTMGRAQGASPVGSPMASPAAPARAEAPELQFVLGLQGPEDLVQIPDTNWIIASSFSGGDDPRAIGFKGGIALIDSTTHTATRFALNPADRARAPYDACSSPPDPAGFSAHGLSIKRQADGTLTLFVVGHGDREAIEVFEVALAGGVPALTWIGCVPAAEGAFNNAVVGLPDGRILVTDFLHAPAVFNDLFVAGKKTGAVTQWTPGGAWETLPGTAMSGPNGIEVSDDLQHLFVADSGSATVWRYDLTATETAPVVIDPGFRTDNLRWGPDGRLLLAGVRPDPACAPDDQGCLGIDVVVALDPETLAFVTLLERPADAAFSYLSSALIVNHVLWLGSPGGDRIAYTPAP